MSDSSTAAPVAPATQFPKSGYVAVEGLVFFPRVLDKIRLQAAGRLPADYNLGTGLDARLCRWLRVDYAALAEQARTQPDDAMVLAWAYAHGRRPDPEEMEYFNAFMMKRGWRDSATEKIEDSKRRRGIAHRADLQTTFDLQDYDEGRRLGDHRESSSHSAS